MQITTIGFDIAKNVFQVHGIDAAERVVVRKQIRRGQLRNAPLLKAESIMLGVRYEKEGKLRVTYAGWDDAKVVLNGHMFRRNGAIRFPSPLSSHPPRKTGGGARRIWDHPMP